MEPSKQTFDDWWQGLTSEARAALEHMRDDLEEFAASCVDQYKISGSYFRPDQERELLTLLGDSHQTRDFVERARWALDHYQPDNTKETRDQLKRLQTELERGSPESRRPEELATAILRACEGQDVEATVRLFLQHMGARRPKRYQGRQTIQFLAYQFAAAGFDLEVGRNTAFVRAAEILVRYLPDWRPRDLKALDAKGAEIAQRRTKKNRLAADPSLRSRLAEDTAKLRRVKQNDTTVRDRLKAALSESEIERIKCSVALNKRHNRYS